MEEERDFTLVKEKRDSTTSKDISTSGAIRSRKSSGNGHIQKARSVDIYGTYTRKRDEEVESASRHYFFEMDEGNLHSIASEEPEYSEQNTIRLGNDRYPAVDTDPLHSKNNRFHRQHSLDNHIDYDTRSVKSKSSSPVRRISADTEVLIPTLACYDVKPVRPSTLDVTPEHSVQTQKMKPYQKGPMSNNAFSYSNNSSSSQSPASTPSPKLKTTPTLNDYSNNPTPTMAMPRPISKQSTGSPANSNRSRNYSANNNALKNTTISGKPGFISFL